MTGAFTLGFLSFKSDRSAEVLSLFGLVLSILFQPTNQGESLFTIHGRVSLFLLTILNQDYWKKQAETVEGINVHTTAED